MQSADWMGYRLIPDWLVLYVKRLRLASVKGKSAEASRLCSAWQERYTNVRGTMTSYRLYLVSEMTERLSPALELEVDDDETAIRWAEEMRAGRRAELWSGNRMVRDWHSK